MTEEEFKKCMELTRSHLVTKEGSSNNYGLCAAINYGFQEHFSIVQLYNYESLAHDYLADNFKPADISREFYYLDIEDEEGCNLPVESHKNRERVLNEFEEQLLTNKEYLNWG